MVSSPDGQPLADGVPGGPIVGRGPASIAAVMRSPLARAAAIGLAARLMTLAVLAVVYLIEPVTHTRIGPFWSRPFAIWDGSWYVGIAMTGYHTTPAPLPGPAPLYDIAFFPMWPAVIRLVSLGGVLPPGIMAGITANVLFVVACPLIYRCLAPRLGSETAMWGVALLAFSPAAYVFSLAYSESLFLVLAAIGLTRPNVVTLFVAGLTRIQGSLVGLGAAVDAFVAGDRRRAVLWLGTSALAFGAWFVVAGWIMGRPDGYLLGTPSWDASLGMDFGPMTLVRNLGGPAVAAFLLMLLLGCAVIARRAPGPVAFAVALVAVAFVLGRWDSMPRFTVCAFPAFAGLAYAVPRLRWVLLVGFAVVQAALIVFIVSGPGGP